MKYYFVGGYVRDELLGIKSKDIDFAVEAPSYEAMREDILARGAVIFQERPEFLSIRARDPIVGPVDYTVTRKDGFYSDARHPDIVHIGTIYEDLARRDFTINAIARDEATGEIIDPHCGQRDLVNKLLRTVGKAEDRFTEDPLRVLRAMRFHITKGFDLHEDIREEFWNIDLMELPLERIYEELRKCFEFDTHATLQFLHDYFNIEATIFNTMGLKLEPVIPEYRTLVPSLMKSQ